MRFNRGELALLIAGLRARQELNWQRGAARYVGDEGDRIAALLVRLEAEYELLA